MPGANSLTDTQDATDQAPVYDDIAKNTQPFAQPYDVNNIKPASIGFLDYVDYMVGGAIAGIIVSKLSGINANVGLGVGIAAGFALGRNQK